MTYEIFLMRVMHRTGLDERSFTQALILAAVEEIAQRLPREHALAIAETLPEPLARRLVDHAGYSEQTLDELYRALADALDLELSFAVEFTQVVFQVFGEAIGRTGRARLGASLPESWHHFFTPRSDTAIDFASRNERHTLATGRPGSTRPLSSARPGHRNSIALSEHPHSGTSLATSHGKPQRRTLAGARHGSSRPISEP